MKFSAIARKLSYGVALGLLASLMMGSLGYWLPRDWRQEVATEPCAVVVYLSGDFVHTNLILPVRAGTFDWESYLSPGEFGARPGELRYFSFGWGDRDFYTQTPTPQDFRLSTAIKALFWPTPSVMYVRGYRHIAPDSSQFEGIGVKPLVLSEAQYQRLARRVLASFQKAGRGEQVVARAKVRDFPGNFYEATGTYWVLRTCNDWTAETLRIADVNTPLWSGLAGAVLHHAQTPCQIP